MIYSDNESIVKEYKKVLIDNGLKQQFIADKLELSKQSMNALLNKKHISFDDMKRICDAMNCDLVVDIVKRDCLE